MGDRQSFWAHSGGKRGYSGVTAYCAPPWTPVAVAVDDLEGGEGDGEGEEAEGGGWAGEGRLLQLDFGPQAFVLINVYVPNAGERPERARLSAKMGFLRALLGRCRRLAGAGREVLLVGDFNVCADPKDVHPRIGLEACYSSEEIELFRSFLVENGGPFVDAWRRRHPEEAAVYTVWDEKTSARPFNQGLRIDFALATPGLDAKIGGCEVLSADAVPPKWSDHAALAVDFGGDLAPPQAHPPCREWTQLNRRFNDPSQRSILAMFGGAKRQGAAAEEGGAEAKRRKEGGG